MSLLGNLTVGILGNMSGLSNSLRQSQTEVEKFAKNVDKMGKSISDIGKSMSLLVTGPLLAIGGTSVKAAADFESAFAGVRKTVDATEEEFAVFAQGIRNMAKEMPQSATEIAKVAEAAGQLGIQNDAILGFTKTMVNMGVATNMASDDAAMALARFATITQMNQQDFDRLGATIVGLGNNLAATESEIVQMGLRLAGAGNVVGMAEHQILGFSGALAAVGINAEAGGTAFSKLMINIANEVATGGDKLEGFAKVAGMSAKEFQKAFQKDAASAIVTFIEGLGKINDAGGNVFGTLSDLGLSEVRLRDAILRAAGAGDVMRESLELGARAWEENRALTDEAAQRYQTFESQLQIFSNRLKDIAITLGEALMPAFLSALDAAQPFIEKLAELADWFTHLDPGIQQMIVTIGSVATAIGPVLVLLGTLTSSISNLIPVFGAVLSPVGLAVTAIAGLTASLVHLYNTNETVRDTLNTAWEFIKNAAFAIFGSIKYFWDNWGEDIIAFFQTTWEYVQDIFEVVFGKISKITQRVFGDLSKLWDKWGTTVIETFKNIWEIIQIVFKNTFEYITNLAKEIFKNLKAFWDRWGETIKILFETIWNVIKRIFEGVWNAILIIIETAIGIISNTVKLFLSVLKGDWEGAWNAVKGIAQSVWDGMKNMFSNVLETMTAIGKDIIQGLINGIKGMAGAAWDAAKDVAQSIGDSVKNFFGIKSPSRLMVGFGKNIGEGLALGMEAEKNAVLRAADDLANAALVDLSGTEALRVEGVSGNIVTNTVGGTGMSGTSEIVVRSPVYLDGELITERVSRIQANLAMTAYRGEGMA